MPESFQHQQLVKILLKEALCLIPSGCHKLIQLDDYGILTIPEKTIDGYRPDLYYRFEGLLIIGEAKTSDDVDKQHSRAQYESYIKECANFQGMAFLIIAVPWIERATAHNMIQILKKKIPGSYTTKILEWIG